MLPPGEELGLPFVAEVGDGLGQRWIHQRDWKVGEVLGDPLGAGLGQRWIHQRDWKLGEVLGDPLGEALGPKLVEAW